MRYALCTFDKSGQPTAIEAVRQPGRRELKLSDGRPIKPNANGWTQDLARACGFLPIQPTPRPDPSGPDKTLDRSVGLINGTPTVVWTERDMTQAEQDARDARQQAKQQADADRATLAAFVAEASPTARQTVEAVKALARTMGL